MRRVGDLVESITSRQRDHSGGDLAQPLPSALISPLLTTQASVVKEQFLNALQMANHNDARSRRQPCLACMRSSAPTHAAPHYGPLRLLAPTLNAGSVVEKVNIRAERHGLLTVTALSQHEMCRQSS